MSRPNETVRIPPEEYDGQIGLYALLPKGAMVEEITYDVDLGLIVRYRLPWWKRLFR